MPSEGLLAGVLGVDRERLEVREQRLYSVGPALRKQDFEGLAYFLKPNQELWDFLSPCAAS